MLDSIEVALEPFRQFGPYFVEFLANIPEVPITERREAAKRGRHRTKPFTDALVERITDDPGEFELLRQGVLA